MKVRVLRRERLWRQGWLSANPGVRHWIPVGTYRRIWRAAVKHPGRMITGRNGAYALYLPPDPERERDEFIRQIMERRPIEPGDCVMLPFEIGRIEGFRFISGEPR